MCVYLISSVTFFKMLHIWCSFIILLDLWNDLNYGDLIAFVNDWFKLVWTFFEFSDLIQVFSEVPRDINFIQHSSRLGWKLWVEYCSFMWFSIFICIVICTNFMSFFFFITNFSNKRGKPMIIDPGLYSLNKSDIWWIIKQRNLPTSFKLYTGLISLQPLSLLWTLPMYVLCVCKCFSSCFLHFTHAILSFLLVDHVIL